MFNKLNTLSWLTRVLSHFQLSFSLPSSSPFSFLPSSPSHFLSLFCNLSVEERESLSCSFPQSRFCWPLFLCCYLQRSLIHAIVLKLLFSSRLDTHSVSGSTFWPYLKAISCTTAKCRIGPFCLCFPDIRSHWWSLPKSIRPFGVAKWQCPNFVVLPSLINQWKWKWRSLSRVCLRPHGLYSPWNSLGQNTGVGSRSLLQVIFGTRLLLNSHQLVVYPEVALVVKNPPVNAGRPKQHDFHPWVGKMSCRRPWQPTPVLLLRESHGQRSLMRHRP